jgi:hypothetical protein
MNKKKSGNNKSNAPKKDANNADSIGDKKA